MIWPIIFSLAVGISTVMQGALNKQMSRVWTFSEILLLNAVVFLVVAILYFYIAKFQGGLLPESLREVARGQGFKWWYIFPGIFGFVIVFGLPVSINYMGALKVFVAVVCAQMVCSLLWDFLVEGTPFSTQRVLGALLAIAAMIVTNV